MKSTEEIQTSAERTEAVRHLTDLPNRKPDPKPWVDVHNLPWGDPEFSKRMLNEHLDESHDAASRRPSVYAGQLAWIVGKLLQPRGAKTVLDLTCGPGLWANDLARRGYIVRGIDIAPSAIEYARKTAKDEGLQATFVQQDIRDAAFGSGYDAVLFIYGEPNAFKWEEFSIILLRIREALNPGGVLILEFSPPEAMERRIGTMWETREEGGLFGDRPYLSLNEYFYDPDRCTACRRYYVVDIATNHVREYGVSYQGYRNEDLALLLSACGLKFLSECDSLTGEKGLENREWQVIVAERDTD